MSPIPRVVIIGRPNVGKSTLFNRLYGRRRALVHDEPGVTRDRLEEQAEWWFDGKKYPVLIVDTGGVGGDRFSEEIDEQVGFALQTADVVLVVFDGPAGITPADREVIQRLKRSGARQPVIGVINKIDAECHESLMNDFYQAGLEDLMTISAEHGRGIDDLKFALRDRIELEEAPQESDEEVRVTPKVAVVGRPNVGKSTLINALLGDERMITSPIAGTTVDSVDSHVVIDDQEFILIDTAGIRRKSKTERGIEVLSVVQTKKALERCDIAILMMDADEGVIDQDEKIGGLIEEVGCSVILAVNKWDTQEGKKRGFGKEEAAEQVRNQMAYLRYAPLLFLSAKKRQGLRGLGKLVDEVLAQRQVKISTHEFTEWVRRESEIHNPMNAKFYMCHQAGRNPPTFVCHVSDPEKVHFSLKRHFINAIREKWGFMGSPIRLLFIEGKGRAAKRPPGAR